MFDMNKDSAISNSRWLHVPRPRINPTLRLFCFSYAGGGSAVFHHWPDGLPAEVEVCGIQLPGRGARMAEPALTSIDAMVPEIEAAIRPYLDRPFAFFGHSMGAKVAFELTRYLRRLGRPLPLHLFASGSRAPQDSRDNSPIHALPAAEFLEQLRDLKGTPAEILNNSELMSLVEPTLRADFQAIETWQYREEKPLNVPISVYGGDRDEGVEDRHLNGWGAQTTGSFHVQLMPGDHFFINTARSALLSQISDTLSLVTRVASAV